MDKVKALVVDDKRVISDMFDFTLGHMGHEITCVRNATEAVRKIKEELFDVAFVDIMMPDKNGVELLKEIKDATPDLPVVMMSGYTVEEKRNRVRELGANAFLDKPFGIDDVRQMIKETTGKDI